MSYYARERRVAGAGAKVHFADTIGQLINVSRSGALIRTDRRPGVGSAWPLTLELTSGVVRLTGKVVRLERAAGFAPGGLRRQVAIGFAFVAPSTPASTLLDKVCGASAAWLGINLVFCRVSLRRHCPQCQSRSVTKAGRHRYACDDCHNIFTGFRVGPLRIAR
jgi:hypothetical protein